MPPDQSAAARRVLGEEPEGGFELGAMVHRDGDLTPFGNGGEWSSATNGLRVVVLYAQVETHLGSGLSMSGEQRPIPTHNGPPKL
jgi:hypothetical protein